jgi:hypothetical protein
LLVEADPTQTTASEIKNNAAQIINKQKLFFALL